jgi:endonuclease YncB( thermonuclease family)
MPQCRRIGALGWRKGIPILSIAAVLGHSVAGASRALLALGVVVASATAASAQEHRVNFGCKLETVGTGVVVSAIDGRTLALTDGREVRLAGIEVAAIAPEVGLAAKRELEAIATGQTVEVRGPNAEPDRYGRAYGQVFAASPSQRWLEADMVAKGYARVSGRVGDRICVTELLARERAARARKLGLWANPGYVIRRADERATLVADRGRFAIVEGKVLSVRVSGQTIYMNFGRRWSEDLTVTISKRSERSFTEAGLEPKRLEGGRVRVRGFIEQRGGPWVRASHPEQIEIAESNRG